MAQHRDKSGQPFGLIGRDVHTVVIQKPLEVPKTSAVVRHVVFDDLRGSEPVLPGRVRHVTTGMKQNIATAPVDEFQQAKNGEAKSEAIFGGLVYIFGAGDTFFDQSRGLVVSEPIRAGDAGRLNRESWSTSAASVNRPEA